jgi:putative intracellular protease/amidase
VKDKRVTAFSDEEEEAVGLAGVVPFSLEDALKKNGAHYERGPAWQSYVVTDGKLVTGQNPASSEAAAEDLLRLLR